VKDITKDRDNFKTLFEEEQSLRKKFETNFTDLSAKHEQLTSSMNTTKYKTLLDQKNTLDEKYGEISTNFENLNRAYNSIRESFNKLKVENKALTEQHKALQERYNHLEKDPGSGAAGGQTTANVSASTPENPQFSNKALEAEINQLKLENKTLLEATKKYQSDISKMKQLYDGLLSVTENRNRISGFLRDRD